MCMDKDKQINWISELLVRSYSQDISGPETRELEEWLRESPENRLLFVELKDERIRDAAFEKMDGYDEEAALRKIKQRIGSQRKVKRLKYRYWVAAAVIALFFAAGYWFFTIKAPDKAPLKIAQTQQDVPPGSTKAILKLADGSTIPLDSAGIGSWQQGRATVQQQGGEILYTANGKAKPVGMNTLITPIGGRFRIVLPDGTKVWLNSSSSLKYPTAFTGPERKVQLTGEAYFEVVHNDKQPFMVSVNGAEIKDIGTAFNIMNYDDEPAMITTVAEGKVQVTIGKETTFVEKEQQARINKESRLSVSLADVPEAIAWKDGIFQFDNETIQPIMREIARWYNVEIIYTGAVTQHFVGKISKDVPVSRVLQLLQLTGDVHFKIEGRTITVSP